MLRLYRLQHAPGHLRPAQLHGHPARGGDRVGQGRRASHFQIFWRLVLPLSVPALAAIATFQFLWVWSDLLIALLYLGTGERQVVTVTLGGLIGSNQIYGWQVVTGGAIITMAVPVLVFVSLQRYFVRGLTAGSVGG
jgi:alpha-glucoside transport system permease protein